jgi:hypothetical protein
VRWQTTGGGWLASALRVPLAARRVKALALHSSQSKLFALIDAGKSAGDDAGRVVSFDYSEDGTVYAFYCYCLIHIYMCVCV